MTVDLVEVRSAKRSETLFALRIRDEDMLGVSLTDMHRILGTSGSIAGKLLVLADVVRQIEEQAEENKRKAEAV